MKPAKTSLLKLFIKILISRHVQALAFSMLLAGIAFAQAPPAEKSLADFLTEKTVYFAEGNFSIALPVDAMGSGAIDKGKNGPAGGYMGFFKEGMIMLGFEDYTDPAFSLKTEKEYGDFFEGHKKESLKRSKAKLTFEGPLVSGGFRGWAIGFRMPDGSTGLARDFYANRRRYSLIAFIKKDVPGAGELMAKVLDSFRPGRNNDLSSNPIPVLTSGP